MGADAVLVQTLWQSGIVAMPSDLAELRAHRGPLPKALSDKALGILQNALSPEDSLQTALMIAWLSKDADLILAVRSVLEQAAPESLAARFACIALQHLDDQSDYFARLALRVAQTEENAAWGLSALRSLGDRGLESLGNWLKSQKATLRTDNYDRQSALCTAILQPGS